MGKLAGFRFAVLLLSLLLVPSAWATSKGDCSRLLVGTLDYFVEKALSRPERQVQTPRFVNPQSEIEYEKQWKIEPAPPLINSFFPTGIGVINHQLNEALGPGVVKADGTGYFMSLRSEVEWRGHTIKTNIGVPITGLLSNPVRNPKYLVRPDAKAVFIFIHGGGTKTTGHHVAIQALNHFHPYQVDVISLDMPWHGEGSRHLFNGMDEVFDYLAAFIDKYVPENAVPVVVDENVPASSLPLILGGHSYGGLVSDMAMRRSDDPEFRLGQRASGFVLLSNVADVAPGQSLAQKFLAQKKIQEDQNRRKAEIADGDLELSENMVADDKVSALSGWHINVVTDTDHDWSLPDHMGEKYKPALAIMGKADGLTYVGYEDLFERYLVALKNVEFILYDEREDFDGKKVKIGHLIFDHYPLSSESGKTGSGKKPTEPETYLEIRKFIESTLKDSGSLKPDEKLESQNNNKYSEQMVIGRIVQTYANNLAFREFINEYVYRNRKPTEKLIALSDRANQLIAYQKQATKIINKAKVAKEEKDVDSLPDIIVLNQRFNVESFRSAGEEKKKLEAIRASAYTPTEQTKKNVRQRKQITAKVANFVDQKKAIHIDLEQMSQQKQRLEKQARELLSGLDILPVSELYKYQQDMRALLVTLRSLDEQVREGLETFAVEYKKHFQTPSESQAGLPTELLKVIEDYEAASRKYQQMRQGLTHVIYKEAINGRLGNELKQLYSDLYGTAADLGAGVYGEQSLEGRRRRLTETSTKLEGYIYRLQVLEQEMLKTYITDMVPGYYEMEEVPMAQLLRETDPQVWQDNQRIFVQAWSQWLKLWGNRPPTEKVSLY